MTGITVDPQFPARPYVYVNYTLNRDPRDTQRGPVWGAAGPPTTTAVRRRPRPPQPPEAGCPVIDRVSRLTAQRTPLGWTMVPDSELALVQDGCAQFSSHASGDVAFGPDGQLYASAGDGASFRGRTSARPTTRAAARPPGQRGRLAAGPGPAPRPRCRRPARHRRHDLPAAPGRPAHPATGDRGPVAGGDGPAQPVAAHLPPGQGAALERRRRLQQLGGDQLPRATPRPPAWSTAGGRATRAPPASRCATPRGRPATSRSATGSTPRVTGAVAAAVLQLPDPHRRDSDHAGRELPGRLLLDVRHRLHAARDPLAEGLPGRAVLLRLPARLHLAAREGRRRPARPELGPGLRAGRGVPGQPRPPVRAATSTTSTTGS